ncbi:MAG: alanine--tRNA ligase, partial [Dehalococcoidales bacterium]
LPSPNIDTGLGLERMLLLKLGKSSIFETDLFTPLLQRVSELTGKQYGDDDTTDHAMRIVAEHGRAVTFLIADGVMPGNEGRGYVLRRLLRRATLFGLRLGLDRPFLAEVVGATVDRMGHVYPEIVERQDFIRRVVELEEIRFSETLKVGLEVLEGVLAKGGARGKRVPGRDAFRLYDTYGLPVELTAEVAAERGLSVDMAGFEKEMEAQRQRAKGAHKFALSPGELDGLEQKLSVKLTPFVGYDSIELSSCVVGLIVDGQPAETVEAGQEAGVILESTPFYGELGGQVGDTGKIAGADGRFEVTDTVHLTPDVIAHQGRVSQGSLSVGDEVVASVAGDRRLDIARNHTATHLLQAALRQVLGDEVQQRGSLVAADRLRFDFSYLTAMMPEEIEQVQTIVNDLVRRNLAVRAEEIPYQQAIDGGAIALFDEKYGDTVRVVKSGQPVVSAELCGGTHVAATGEIGLFQITSESSIGSGMRRIEAVTGRGAEALISERLAGLEEIARAVGGTLDEVTGKVAAVVAERDEARKQSLGLERELARITAEKLLTETEVVNGTTVLAARVPPLPQQVLREMADMLRDRLKSAVIVLGTVHGDRPSFLAAVTPDLVKQGHDAGKIVKQVARVTGGGGGGKPAMAQAGGRDAGRLDEALRLVKTLI